MSNRKPRQKQPSNAKHNDSALEKVGLKDTVFKQALDELKEQLECVVDPLDDEPLPSHLRRFARQLGSDLDQTGTRFKSSHSRDGWSNGPLSRPQRLRDILKYTDPILSYTIAEMIRDTDLRKAHADRALSTYVGRSEDYDAVLGETIPEKLRKAAAPRIAKRKYRDGTNATASDDWDVFVKDFCEQKAGLPTGLKALDDALGGGINDLSVISGNEASGKTTLALMIMVAALRADPRLGCVFYTIDQSKRQTLKKFFAHVAGVSPAFLKLTPEERPAEVNQQIDEAEIELRERLLPRIKFVEKSNLPVDAPLTLNTLIAFDSLLCGSADVDRVLVIVDLFQSLAELSQEGTANEADEYCLALIQRFMEWSRTDDCPEGSPVILTSEVRKVDRVELTNNDLRGSARLGSTPVNILHLWPTKDTNQTGDIVPRTLLVGKSRNGEQGRILHLNFHHKIATFSEAADKAYRSRKSSSESKERSRGKQL